MLRPSSIFSDALKKGEMKKVRLPYKLPILGRTVHVEVEVEVEVGSPYATELIFKFKKFKTPSARKIYPLSTSSFCKS